MSDENPIVSLIGKESFQWLSGYFNQETLLAEVPDEILKAVAVIDVSTRDFGADRNAVTAIALVTFAYRLAGRRQQAHLGPRDLLLVKVLAKEELKRRDGRSAFLRVPEELPLFEIVTGEVGDRIRSMATINSPFCRGA
ncbi:hypothetical protein TRIP_B200504 [uncultured Desulfatiglans sp.]|uniref:Uncharacterized protein n=1 Tax=Uncultured Desulfatiglans sp. TaxID=1748965 RepID=A0A653A2Y2_UNCDX|nr:hypothetical protein TRIP_B200504 [uncultured Desulfatiglans sp.]